jgi:DNA polymerase epsilon subunit
VRKMVVRAFKQRSLSVRADALSRLVSVLQDSENLEQNVHDIVDALMDQPRMFSRPVWRVSVSSKQRVVYCCAVLCSPAHCPAFRTTTTAPLSLPYSN